ncbi:carboxymuconolactone decarboxylase family protein [Aestuariivivens sediminicola]|uniref:carboxymuconolactone decarboxylase family protein n=1 Tax=Aestuariivivens sediminicola TaxID=2913560 RepID=UPI001F55EFA8|nr:carboxymuconolactone decarboxylase family protein [Aestuariivivens sediminicola]
MRNFLVILVLISSLCTGFAQDVLTPQEKAELLAKSPFNSLYPTSVLKSADEFFDAMDAVLKNGAIEEKEAHLIALGTAAATKCKYCIPYHLAEAKRLGATEEEIKTAVLIASDVLRMSTLLYGNDYDMAEFRKLLSGN